jgi:hypothetical protein
MAMSIAAGDMAKQSSEKSMIKLGRIAVSSQGKVRDDIS